MKALPFKIYLFVILLGFLENAILAFAFKVDFYFCLMSFIAYTAVITMISAALFLRQEERGDQKKYIDEVVHDREHKSLKNAFKIPRTLEKKLSPEKPIINLSHATIERIQKVRSLRKYGYKVEELTSYQYRINNLLDLYPVSCKYHNIKTQERGVLKNFENLDKALKTMKHFNNFSI